MLAILLVAAWLGLFVSFDGLHWFAVKYRAQGVLHRFKAAAEPLLREWLTESGWLPEADEYYSYPVQRPDTLLLASQRRPVGQPA